MDHKKGMHLFFQLKVPLFPLVSIGGARIAHDSLNIPTLDLKGAGNDISEVDFSGVRQRLSDGGWLSGGSVMSNQLGGSGGDVNRRYLV